MATTDTTGRLVDVQAFIDAERVSPLQKRLLFLCFLVIAIDLGAMVVGRLTDRFEPHRVLFASYLTGAACIVLISLSTHARGLMALAVFVAGACISGGQVGGNALSAAFYPTPYRANGVAWANGAGRAGSIVGSLLGGLLLGFGWPATKVYALVSVPAVISAVALVTLGRLNTAHRPGGAHIAPAHGMNDVEPQPPQPNPVPAPEPEPEPPVPPDGTPPTHPVPQPPGPVARY